MLEHIAQPAPADTNEEYRAATTGAAIFDRSDFAKLLVTGPDATMFLGNLSTNDIKNLPVGGGCESFFCDHRAKALFQTWIDHRHTPEQGNTLWIETVPGRGEALFKHLDRYLISEAVELRNVTAEYSEYHLAGPNAKTVLEATLGAPLPELAEFQNVETVFGAYAMATIRRHDWLELPGYDVVSPKAHEEGVWQMLTAAGALPASEETFNVLRIEAGQPMFGPDIDENRFVMEIGGAERSVSYTKGCYLGQEPIVMARDRAGHAPRSFVQMRFPRGSGVAAGTKLFVGTEDTGTVTSACDSPRYDASLALGYVRWKHREPGTALEVQTEAGRVTGEVMKR